jgi:hypothetical protein
MGRKDRAQKDKDETLEIVPVIPEVNQSPDASIKIPKGMDWDGVIEFGAHMRDRDDQVIEYHRDLQAFPIDAAVVISDLIMKTFGNTRTRKALETMFGKVDVPPVYITVQVSPKVNKTVAWGSYQLPGTEGGQLDYVPFKDNGEQWRLRVKATHRRKYESVFMGLLDAAEEELRNSSIYRGQALYVDDVLKSGSKFDPNQNQPRFIDGLMAVPSDLILPHDVMRDISAGIFTPIMKAAKLEMLGVPKKRAAVLMGTYGVGKTLTANVASHLATSVGRTSLYLKDVRKLPECVHFARLVGGPTLVFAEDIDRVVSGNRTAELDSILNIVDGLDTKHLDILFVFTTNHPEKINEAFLRAGRSDMLIEIPTPDAEAAERLIRKNLGMALPADVDVEVIAIRCAEAELIPADLREVAERSKLYAVDEDRSVPTFEDLELSAKGVIRQSNMRREPKDTKPDLVSMGEIMVPRAVADTKDVSMLSDQVEDVSDLVRCVQSVVEE